MQGGRVTSLPGWSEAFFNNFDMAVIDAGLEWNQVEPEPGRFDFSLQTDGFVNRAKQYDMRIRMQALVFTGYFQDAPWLPAWLKNGTFSRDDAIRILENHIKTIMNHYKGKVDEWVVVNEPYIHPYRPHDVFNQFIGPEYVDLAFQAAKEADPKAKLIFNDAGNHIATGPTTTLDKSIITRLETESLVDKIGLQMHIDGSDPPWNRILFRRCKVMA